MKKLAHQCAALACVTIACAAPGHAADTLFEFYNTTLNHYFLTIDPDEAAAIDSGAAGPGRRATPRTCCSAYRSRR